MAWKDKISSKGELKETALNSKCLATTSTTWAKACKHRLK
jgi:hypothetical protein